MEYEDRVTIATPEGVELELTLAGIGSRMIAGMTDLAIQIVTWLLLWLLFSASGAFEVGTTALAIIAFLLIFGYDVGFEVLANGRTPGKRMTGLRVVREGGHPISFVPSAIRNVLRIVDILPVTYGVAMLFVFLTERNQRVGDLAAGTLVVRERLGGRRRPSAAGWSAPGPGLAASWDVSGVSNGDVATVRSFLARRPELDPAAAGDLARELARRLRPLVAGVPPHVSDLQFLEMLSAAKAARE